MSITIQLTPSEYDDLAETLAVAYNSIEVSIEQESDPEIKADLRRDQSGIDRLITVIGQQAYTQMMEKPCPFRTADDDS